MPHTSRQTSPVEASEKIPCCSQYNCLCLSLVCQHVYEKTTVLGRHDCCEGGAKATSSKSRSVLWTFRHHDPTCFRKGSNFWELHFYSLPVLCCSPKSHLLYVPFSSSSLFTVATFTLEWEQHSLVRAVLVLKSTGHVLCFHEASVLFWLLHSNVKRCKTCRLFDMA